MKTKESPEVWISLSKTHLTVGVAIQLGVVLVGVVVAYFKALGDIDTKIHSVQSQNIQTFAKREDLKQLGTKIDVLVGEVQSMSVEWSRLNGYLKAKGLYDK